MKKLMKSLLFSMMLVLSPAVVLAGPVDINTASAEEIAKNLEGIGLRKAKEIVKYRTANGPFKAKKDLAKVQGIGLKTVEKNMNNIKLGKASGGGK